MRKLSILLASVLLVGCGIFGPDYYIDTREFWYQFSPKVPDEQFDPYQNDPDCELIDTRIETFGPFYDLIWYGVRVYECRIEV